MKAPEDDEIASVPCGPEAAAEDKAFWIDDSDQAIWRWLRVLDRAEDGDSSALVALLRSDYRIPKAARWFIADLLERRALARRPGEQSTPAWRRTETQAEYELAEFDFRSQRNALRALQPKERRHAQDEIALKHGLDPQRFNDHLKRWRNATRSLKKRLPPALE